uniref:Uncharacterized protein n=1 Tax=Borrelia garinii subsp. bavariensis (strain ATCC BAA-2496 / DSM 23469 / PBi) TaxID=290434 RepID=A0A7I6GX78_BORGP|nr:hypothetical protein BGP034 [Borreliella bavariensis PBi]
MRTLIINYFFLNKKIINNFAKLVIIYKLLKNFYLVLVNRFGKKQFKIQILKKRLICL